jgi:hypothetical protein
MDATTLRDRVRSLVTGTPFGMVEAPTPFSFAKVPQGLFDAGDVVRVGIATTGVIGLLGPAEEREDELTLAVAAAYTGVVEDTVARLHTVAHSLTAAVLQAGAGAGDFVVPDGGREVTVEAPEGAGYAVMRLTLPVAYLAAL